MNHINYSFSPYQQHAGKQYKPKTQLAQSFGVTAITDVAEIQFGSEVKKPETTNKTKKKKGSGVKTAFIITGILATLTGVGLSIAIPFFFMPTGLIISVAGALTAAIAVFSGGGKEIDQNKGAKQTGEQTQKAGGNPNNAKPKIKEDPNGSESDVKDNPDPKAGALSGTDDGTGTTITATQKGEGSSSSTGGSGENKPFGFEGWNTVKIQKELQNRINNQGLVVSTNVAEFIQISSDAEKLQKQYPQLLSKIDVESLRTEVNELLGSSEKKGLAEKSILLKLIRAFPEQKKASKTKQHINKTEPISDWKFFRLMALYITGAVLAMWGGRTLYMEAMKKFVEEPQAKERKIERGNLAFNKKAAPIFQAEKDTLLEALSSARDSADYPKVEQLLSEYHQNGYKNPLETMIKAIDEHEAQYAIYNPSSSERKKLEQELENAKNRLEALEKDDFKYEIYDQHVTSKSLLDDVYYDAVKSRRVVKLDEKIKEHEANLISDSTLLARYLEPNGIVETHKKIGKLQSRLNNKQMYNDNQFSDNEKAYFVEELLKTHIRNVLQLYTENDDFFLDEELVLEPLPEEAENYLKEINESSQYDKTRLQKKIAAYHLFQSAYVEVLQSYTQYGPMQAKNYVKEGFETVLGDLSEFEGLIQRENPVINTGDINAAKLKQQENDRKKEKVELEKRQQIIKKEVDRLKLNEITDKNFDKKIATNEKTLWVLFYDPLSERALTDINKIAKLNQHFKREGGFDFAVGDIHHNRRTLQKHTKITGIEAQSFPLMLVSENGTVSAESAENVLNYDVPNNSSDSSEKLLLDSLEMPNPPVEIQQDVMGLPEDYNIPELTLVGTDYSGQGAVSIDGNISGIENSAGYIMYEEIFSKLAKLKNKKIITIFWNEQCDERSQFFEALSKVDQSQYFVTSVKLPATPTAIENLKQSQYLAKNVLKITKDVTAIRAPKVVVFDKNGLSTEVISRLEKLNKIFSPSIE